jgi:hypothetical protein
MFNWIKRKNNDDKPNQIRLTHDMIRPPIEKIEFPSYNPSLFQIIRTFAKEQTYILPNEPLFLIRNFEELHIVSMPFGGYVNSISTIANHLKLNELFLDLEIIEDIEHLKSCRFENQKEILLQTEIVLQQDEFTDEKSISFSKVASQETQFLKFHPMNSESLDWFGFTIGNNNGYEYLLFHLHSDTMSLNKGDQIIFLFENKSKLHLAIEKTSNQSSVPYDLSLEIIRSFLENKIDKIKVSDNKRGAYQIFIPEVQFSSVIPVFYDANKQYFLKEEANFLINLMFDEYLQMNRRFQHLN